MAVLIDIATVVERDSALIRTKKNPDGLLYELVNLDDLGPYEHARIVSLNEKAQKLMRADRPLTAVEKREVRKALGDFLTVIIPTLEPTALKEMDDTVRARIVQAWAAKAEEQMREQAAGNPPRPRTGADSSHASKRSTAAARKNGSTSRPGR